MYSQFHYIGTSLSLLVGVYFLRFVFTGLFEDESAQVDEWLDQNDLGDFKKLFREYGISTLSGCGSPDAMSRLPELPAAEERRLRRAAQVLQQRLILRQWLATHRLQHAYPKLLSLDVSSLEDVYWLEDSVCKHVLAVDFGAWSAARQSLPTGKEALQTLKQDLWSVVVKSSKHQDAWTWGGMLVVSVSVCGLVTLAAMTQPALAPEAKHSLLQYVTGKYLHPPSCRVEWGWEEPQEVGGTLTFSVHCYQRNGQPYPICDTDNLTVHITHQPDRKITPVIELGSDDPAEANIARVKFTVRTAGLYIISVMIGGAVVGSSPYRRWLVAGRALARRCGLATRGAQLCTERQPRALHIHTRDEHDNPTQPTTMESFTIELAPLGGLPDPELSSLATFHYEPVNQRVTLTLLFPQAGVYKATVSYDGQVLNNGQFDCIVLTASEMATVQRNMSCKRGVSYCARLISGLANIGDGTETSRNMGDSTGVSKNTGESTQVSGRGRRVLLVMSSRHLIVKDYLFRLIPKRITSFRLCPSTKLVLLPSSGDTPTPGGMFSIQDGSGAGLVLSSPQRELIAANIARAVSDNIGGEDCFKNKQEYVYSEVRKAHSRYPHDKISLRVTRSDLLRSSLKATKNFTIADWCKNFHVTFHGEQGVDWGGVRREWFSLLCALLFDGRTGLFCCFHEERDTGLVHPNPNRPPHLKLKHFELAGRIVGKCVYESALGGAHRQLVTARFTRSFLAQVIGTRVHYKHFEQDDPELYLSKIKYVLETDLEADGAPELYFCDEEYDEGGKLSRIVDLKPGGRDIKVTNDTKLQYLDLLAQWRLCGRCRSETNAFLRGLTALVPDTLLAIFQENELELLICGTGSLSVADWRAHALVSGSGARWRRTVGWLWAALEALSGTERAKVLQFTTGCSQLPPHGFQELNPRFQITAAPTFGALPTAHTCFNQLCLPDYDSYEQLLHALLLAINEGGEGFGMI